MNDLVNRLRGITEEQELSPSDKWAIDEAADGWKIRCEAEQSIRQRAEATLESLAAKVKALEEEIAILKNSDVGMLRAQMHSDLQMFEEEIAKVRAAYTASIQRENDLLDEIAKLKGHAEARDVEIIRLSAHAASLRKYIETDAFECPTAVADYDRDYPEES